MNKYYSGVGSRSTPNHILITFKNIAAELAKRDYILRSGGAEGADQSFEQGCDKVNGQKEIYIPWKGFADSDSALYNTPATAIKMASEIHPAWDKVSKWGKILHGRNCLQILGKDLKTPSEFVVCWTPNGELKGGTATAINLAIKHNIKVYNFAIDEDIETFSNDILPITIDNKQGYLYEF